MMECLFKFGGSRKHRYTSYKTLFLRQIKYKCLNCGKKLTEWEYANWKGMWEERDKLLLQHLKNNSRKVIL
jgi:hypothetical protein